MFFLQLGLEYEPSEQGLRVTAVAEGGPAEAEGLRVGDVIVEACGLPPGQLADLAHAWIESGLKPNKAVQVVVNRGRTKRYAALLPPRDADAATTAD